MLPVKFYGGLFISFLRNKQLLPKKGEGPKITVSNSSDFFNFQIPIFEERADLGRSLTFLELIFLVNEMDNTTSNLTQSQKCFSSID
jgi:hypothetical protein